VVWALAYGVGPTDAPPPASVGPRKFQGRPVASRQKNQRQGEELSRPVEAAASLEVDAARSLWASEGCFPIRGAVAMVSRPLERRPKECLFAPAASRPPASILLVGAMIPVKRTGITGEGRALAAEHGVSIDDRGPSLSPQRQARAATTPRRNDAMTNRTIVIIAAIASLGAASPALGLHRMGENVRRTPNQSRRSRIQTGRPRKHVRQPGIEDHRAQNRRAEAHG